MTLDKPKNNWPWVLAAAVLLVALAFAAWHFILQAKKAATIAPAPSHTFQVAPPIPALADVPKVQIAAPKKLKVLDKKVVAKKLDLPALVSGNLAAADEEDAALKFFGNAQTAELPAGTVAMGEAPAFIPASTPSTESTPSTIEVLTTAELPASENGAEAVTLLDTRTGESTTVVKEKVSPWFQFQNGVVAGLRYGVNTDLTQTGTAYLGWEFLRVKDLHFIGYGEVNTAPQGKVQLDIQYRRK